MTKDIIELPFGIIQLFRIKDSSEIQVNNELAYRPDKVLQKLGLSSFKDEMANNRASNISPISMSIRKKYVLLDNLFLSYFRRV